MNHLGNLSLFPDSVRFWFIRQFRSKENQQRKYLTNFPQIMKNQFRIALRRVITYLNNCNKSTLLPYKSSYCSIVLLLINNSWKIQDFFATFLSFFILYSNSFVQMFQDSGKLIIYKYTCQPVIVIVQIFYNCSHSIKQYFSCKARWWSFLHWECRVHIGDRTDLRREYSEHRIDKPCGHTRQSRTFDVTRRQTTN